MKHCKYCGKTMKDKEYIILEGLCPECCEASEANYQDYMEDSFGDDMPVWIANYDENGEG